MDPGFITLMRKLAPDLIDEITRRALILERIAALQPVGRRQLAARLNLPEREIRNTAAILKDLGYIELDASGMSLSGKAEEVLETARAFSKAMSGLTEMEQKLSELLPADRVLIAPGNADEDTQVLSDVGRICAGHLRSLLQNGNTLAVTGGRTIAAVARSLQSPTPLNVMVVPARGGIGRSVELQANTLAEEIAGRLGGHYRLIHLPDHIDAAAMQEMLKMPEVQEAMELLEKEINIIHIKDYVFRDGAIKSCAAGLGEMDYEAILRFAAEKKPGIQMTLEDTKPENAEDARLFITGIYQSVSLK